MVSFVSSNPAARQSVTRRSADYDEYLTREWEIFANDGVRQTELRQLAADLNPASVLDVGCGGGQDLIAFATHGCTCVGIDIAPESAIWARQRFRSELPDAVVRFATCAAEALPFNAGAFDMVVCRLAIPYTDNGAALAEMSRVLKDGGTLLLKTHTARYYVSKFLEGVRKRSPLFSVHAARVLISGAIHQLTGHQPRGRVLLREVFQTDRLLRRQLARVGLTIQRELSDSNAGSHAYLITKAPLGTSSERPRLAA